MPVHLKRRAIAPALAAAMLASGCSGEPPVSVQNAAEATIANLEAQSNALEALAADQVNAAGADELSNAAAAFEASEAPANTGAANTL